MKIQSYRDLEVWRLAMDLVDAIYDVTSTFPQDERYGLAQQMRRCAVSIASNIAEGSARAGTKELLHFLFVAKGSLAELDTQILIAQRRGYIINNEKSQLIPSLLISQGKMLTRLLQSLQEKLPTA